MTQKLRARNYSREHDFSLEDRLQLREEPSVDVRHLPDLLDGVAAVERGRDREDTLVSGVNELLVDILDEVVLDCPNVSILRALSRRAEHTFANPAN